MKPEDVKFMFQEMIQRTEQLFFSPMESVDSRLMNLPSFLTALASIVKEMDEVSFVVLLLLLSIMYLFVVYFSVVCYYICLSSWYNHISSVVVRIIHSVSGEVAGSVV